MFEALLLRGHFRAHLAPCEIVGRSLLQIGTVDILKDVALGKHMLIDAFDFSLQKFLHFKVH